MFGDDEWFRSLVEAEVTTTDVAEAQVTHAAHGATSRVMGVDPKKVRHLQIGKLVRTYVSRPQ